MFAKILVPIDSKARYGKDLNAWKHAVDKMLGGGGGGGVWSGSYVFFFLNRANKEN